MINLKLPSIPKLRRIQADKRQNPEGEYYENNPIFLQKQRGFLNNIILFLKLSLEIFNLAQETLNPSLSLASINH